MKCYFQEEEILEVIINSSHKERLVYYATGIFPFLLIIFILGMIKVHLLNICFFALAFLWNFTLKTPQIDQKIDKLNYRFSFLRLQKKMTYFYSGLPEKFLRYEFFLRSIAPLMFIYIFVWYSEIGITFYPLMGVFSFELFYFLYRKFSPNIIS